jgi:hypothetical protein
MVSGSRSEALEIRYKGSPVHDVRLLVVRVWNSGNKEIVPTDYDEPLLLQFGGQLLTWDVIESTPLEALPKVKTAFGLNYVKEARDVAG